MRCLDRLSPGLSAIRSRDRYPRELQNAIVELFALAYFSRLDSGATVKSSTKPAEGQSRISDEILFAALLGIAPAFQGLEPPAKLGAVHHPASCPWTRLSFASGCRADRQADRGAGGDLGWLSGGGDHEVT